MNPKHQSMHCEEKNLLLLPTFKPWIIQPIAYSLRDYAIPAPFRQVLKILHYFACEYILKVICPYMTYQKYGASRDITLNATWQHTPTNYAHHTQRHAIHISMYFNALILWFCFVCKVPWAQWKKGYINHLYNKTSWFCTCYDSEFRWHSRNFS